MRMLAVLLLAMVVIVSTRLFVIRRGRRRDFDGEASGMGHETASSFGWDPLTSELSGRIFDRGDSDFVASQTSRQMTRQFRRERTALALDLLRTVGGQVNQFVRTHLRASRRNNDLKPADELKLWWEFLLFHFTSGILYLMILVCGPARAAKLLEHSLGFASQLRKVTEEVLPAGRQVAAEFMNNKQEPKNGDAIE